MKKIFVLCILVLLLCSFLNDKDTVVLKHTNYTSTFNKSLRYPLMVEWWETRAKSECANRLPRNNKFSKDPLLPRYTDLGEDYLRGNSIRRNKNLKIFDRGHMCPARVNQCQGELVQNECFYYSNMAPQFHALNAGDWKSLETFTYQTSIEQDSVHVWAGSIGTALKIGKVSVPTHCWKVIYIKRTKKWYAYLFKNDTSKPDGFENNRVQVLKIEKLTGFKFNK